MNIILAMKLALADGGVTPEEVYDLSVARRDELPVVGSPGWEMLYAPVSLRGQEPRCVRVAVDKSGRVTLLPPFPAWT